MAKSLLVFYEIESLTSGMDWQAAWKEVEFSYGVNAICRNAVEHGVTVEQLSDSLEAVFSETSGLITLLQHESALGANFVFVQTEDGQAVSGLNLLRLG